MTEWWPVISGLCIGVPISIAARFPPLMAGFFCLGLEVMFKYWGK